MIGFIIFLFGLAIGSFLNVIVYRLNIKKSFLSGRSFCPYCKKIIAWFDNIPLLSFILLAGNCRQCKKKISWQYPLVELVTGLVFWLIYLRFGLTGQTLVYFIFCGILEVIFIYDLKYYLILDTISLPAILLALILNLLLGQNILNLLLGGLLGGGFFAFQYYVSRGRWVGDGDIRLGALMGVMLGWPYLLVALLVAYVVGAIYGLVAIGLKKKAMKSEVPFGPFLTFSTLVAMLYGQLILNWYLNLLY
ncbi:MAG: prepilin peptidase [Candidatus Buchananbacteria bacterium]